MSKNLPHDASLTDDRVDVGTSVFPTVTTADIIVAGLVSHSSGNPRQMMTPRYGTTGLCATCGLDPRQLVPSQSPSQSPQAQHDYSPVVARSPGTHQDVVWNRTQNNPDDAGQPQTDNDDPEISSGRSAARFRQGSSRQVPFQAGEGPFPG
jgi:hypothetical protein